MPFAALLELLSERLGAPLEDAGGVPAVAIGDLLETGREALLTTVRGANHLYAGTGGGALAMEPGRASRRLPLRNPHFHLPLPFPECPIRHFIDPYLFGFYP